MNIRPLYDRCVIKRIEGDVEKTSGGLFIPESAKEKPQEGEVFAVGKGKRLEDGKFRWPRVQDGVMRLSAAQLSALLEGLDWSRVHAPRVTRPRAVQ